MKKITAYALAISLVIGAGGVFAARDEALLEDLGADLLNPASTKKVSPLDEHLLQQLDREQRGEDVHPKRTAKNSQMMQVVTHMQDARARLERLQESAQASLAQQDALSQLDIMIAELAEKKSKCSGQCDQPASPTPGKKPGSSSKPGETAATAASGTTSQSEARTPMLRAAGDLVKDLWGHLPERQREQILQPLSAEFLPEYAVEIEAYYRQLAEPKK